MMSDTDTPSSWTKTRSKIALAKRRDPDADVTDLKVRLRAERLELAIRESVALAPPLTDAQRERLAALLRPGASAGGPDAA